MEKFGPAIARTAPRKQTRSARKNKVLGNLRKAKQRCKKAWKTLSKAGLADSPEAKIISKRWHRLLRQHNKLRKSLNTKRRVEAANRADARFKKDPYKFAKKLFEKSGKKGAPSCSSNEAFSYFSKLYRDENREYAYDPPPGLKRPKLPDYAFSRRCPTRKELARSVRRKRNAASPGLNSLPYLPYKKCPAIIGFIHKLGRKI